MTSESGAGQQPHESVEQEAHRLVSAASAWWQAQSSRADRQPYEAAQPSGQADESPGHHSEDGEAPGHTDGASQTCQGCPWCRAKSAFGPASAETLDGLADLLDAASQSLRTFAHDRRTAADGRTSESWRSRSERADARQDESEAHVTDGDEPRQETP